MVYWERVWRKDLQNYEDFPKHNLLQYKEKGRVHTGQIFYYNLLPIFNNVRQLFPRETVQVLINTRTFLEMVLYFSYSDEGSMDAVKVERGTKKKLMLHDLR